MPKTRPPYPPEFRAEAVRLAHSSGQPVSVIARELGVSVESLRNWIHRKEWSYPVLVESVGLGVDDGLIPGLV